MRDIILETATVKSVIHCGSGSLKTYAPLLKDRQLFVVTDSNVYALYNNLIKEYFEDAPVFVFEAGESSKTFATLGRILENMLERGMKRNCTVIAFGGGVVGDIAGLAACLYMRGTGLVQIPTTLLSQVDSSVGGKTAVDMGKVKNAVGAFYQPEIVIADPLFFATLPERELRCGLGEIIKYGALDKDIFAMLNGCGDLFSHSFMEDIVYHCIAHKAKVVKADERDSGGVRKTLNLGHTTGHALELYYGDKSHGECVLAGMYYELYIAGKLGICGGQYADELKKLILKVIEIPAPKDIESAADLAAYDKKNRDSNISMIVPKASGESTEIKLPLKDYKAYLSECASSL